MSAIQTLLFALLTGNALVVLLLGIGAAVVILLDLKQDGFWERIPRAAIALVLSSFGCGALLWAADFLFGG